MTLVDADTGEVVEPPPFTEIEASAWAQPVTAWHVATLTRLGLNLDADRSGGVATSHLRQGATSERAGQELVLVFVRGLDHSSCRHLGLECYAA